MDSYSLIFIASIFSSIDFPFCSLIFIASIFSFIDFPFCSLIFIASILSSIYFPFCSLIFIASILSSIYFPFCSLIFIASILSSIYFPFCSLIFIASILSFIYFPFCSLIFINLLAQTPETKKPPNIPRLNSFKKDTNSAIAHRRRLHSNDDVTIRDGNPSDRSSSLDTSIDSGLHSHSTVSETTYDVVQNSGKRSSAEADVYDPLPPAATKPPRIYPTHRPAGSSHLQVIFV